VPHELDDKPALDLYKTYLGKQAAGFPCNALLLPLTIRHQAGDTTPVVRTILGTDEAQKSMAFGRPYAAGCRRSSDARQGR